MKTAAISLLVLGSIALGVGMLTGATRNEPTTRPSSQPAARAPMRMLDTAALDVATFAGGCFWCTEADFEKLPGVVDAISGYTGGPELDPTYEQVGSGRTGHYEAVQVYYDPAKVSYSELVEYFWRHVNPTDAGGQFVDRGKQYRTAIFYHDTMQRQIAERSKDALGKSGVLDKPVVTPILPLVRFYRAEEYHQDFYMKDPGRYNSYRAGSGREAYRLQTWGADKPARTYSKPSDEELRKRLTPLQYDVTQKSGTEPPFRNEFWENHEDGIYVDIVSGEPLFSSKDKFNSGTGWPSFTRPLAPENINEHKDVSAGMTRTEVRSKHADSHLGHLFDDGPAPTGLRYCINSASLRFVPKGDLAKEGYSEYLKLFE